MPALHCYFAVSLFSKQCGSEKEILWKSILVLIYTSIYGEELEINILFNWCLFRQLCAFKVGKNHLRPSIYSKTENFLSFSFFEGSWETVDLGKSRQADSNGPPFQRKKILKFTLHGPPGVLQGPLRGPSSGKFWGNFFWLERPIIVEPISIKKPFVAICSRSNHTLTPLLPKRNQPFLRFTTSARLTTMLTMKTWWLQCGKKA